MKTIDSFKTKNVQKLDLKEAEKVEGGSRMYQILPPGVGASIPHPPQQQ